MKRFIQVILSALGICAGCSTHGLLTPAQFTAEYVAALKAAAPSFEVTVIKDLELRVKAPNGTANSCFLYNAYDNYKLAPGSKDEVIKTSMTASLEAVAGTKEPLDRARIVPVIKDRAWLADARQALIDRGANKIPEWVSEDFSPDLIILYVEDSPKNMKYLTSDMLATAKIDRSGLRALACENLQRIIPKMERQGGNGLYMLTAGGDYEASLLVIDSIWDAKELGVDGEIVVAIPTRDLLLVTGTRNPAGIAKMKELVAKATAEGSYRLTPKLFVRRDGKFAEFKE